MPTRVALKIHKDFISRPNAPGAGIRTSGHLLLVRDGTLAGLIMPTSAILAAPSRVSSTLGDLRSLWASAGRLYTKADSVSVARCPKAPTYLSLRS